MLLASHVRATADRTGRAVLSAEVMAALRAVPRHRFVAPHLRDAAYDDRPLPIAAGKTLSQPFIVALMSDLLDLEPHHRVLEIGTGCGYQTAVLARLATSVDSVELNGALSASAARTLRALGVANVHLHVANGWHGWVAGAPYDRVILTAAPAHLPRALVTQLRPGGCLVAPVGPAHAQQLVRVTLGADGSLDTQAVLAVRFSALDAPPRDA